MKLQLKFMAWPCSQEGGGSGRVWSVWTSRKSTYRRDSFSGSFT